MTTDTDLKLEITRTIAASPEAVFDAWLNPEMLAQFMTPMPDVIIPEATADAREGGRFKVVMRVGDQDLPHAGTYKTIKRPDELAFTWESPMSPVEDSTVTLKFASVPDGTEVTLRHVRFPSEESRDNHEKGWGGILEALNRVLSA
ncbi:MAG: SRPBCC domain-containing protein [Silicimonas sp.]|nr:SRPBCC domain-containing protein [Silicimonas sp.]